MSSIRDYVLNQPLFSTHDHQRGFTEWEKKKKNLDYRVLFAYALADLVAALGRSGESWEPLSDEEFRRAWPAVRTTGYGQAVSLSSRLILGRELDAGNTGEITRLLQDFCRDRTAPRLYEDMFRLADVQWDVNDTWWQQKISADILSGREHPEETRQALRCNDDKLFVISTPQEIKTYEEEYQCSITKLGDLERMVQEYIQGAKGLGRLVALKSAVAYLRPLNFENVPRAQAAEIFDGLLQGKNVTLRPLHDYLFHFFVQQGRVFNLPVQIHTGYLARPWGNFRQGDPAPLVPLLRTYRDVRFDLFHAGWPYSSIMAAIGKSFPNVWLDLCWAWAMNPVRAGLTLAEWLASVPHNKIFGFGADTDDPLTLVGYAAQARQGIAAVLEEKVESGEYDQRTAEHVARRIMFQNARDFFGV
jgi:uncharacterized protein